MILFQNIGKLAFSKKKTKIIVLIKLVIYGNFQLQYLLLRRPSRTLYVRSWNAKSTAGRDGRWDNVLGCVGTIWTRTAPLPLFLSPTFKRASLAPTDTTSS